LIGTGHETKECSTGMSAAGLGICVVLAATAQFSSCARAQELSADLVTTPSVGYPEPPRGKLYVSSGKVRIQTGDALGDYFLVDLGGELAYYVRPAQRTFMDARQSSRLTEIFVPLDPGNPCPNLQTMMKVAGVSAAGGVWQCDPLGRDVVDGRGTIQYGIGFPQRHMTLWIDPKLKFAIKMQAGVEAAELRDIREGQWPASLFEIPTGYRRFDPQQLIDRIKQSDVWVEPPP
jgi:hypothetical protein